MNSEEETVQGWIVFYAANKIDLHGGGGLQERGNVV